MLRVVVLIHRYGSLHGSSYWMGAIAACWRERGVSVNVITDPSDHTEADVGVLHVDLTRIPAEYLAWARRFPATVNGAVADISKRTISSNLVRRADSFRGPVIVKTNRNCAGYPERALARMGRAAGNTATYREYLSERRRDARRRLRYGSAGAFQKYRVLDSAEHVPETVWRDRDLVVERFLPERRGDLYCVRTWLFFGDQDRHAMFYSHDPIVKSHNVVGYERLGEVPGELRERRRELGFDFGKFDYTVVEGRPILFDANRTPTIGKAPPERYLPLAKSLAKGLNAFSRSGRAGASASGRTTRHLGRGK